MKDKIRVVHYGISHDHSTSTLATARKYPDIYEIVGVCEPNDAVREARGKDKAYDGLPWLTEEELFSRNDIDAVFCEGYELESVAQAQKCIDHGLHVHLDKPGGTDLDAFAKLLHDAKERGLTLQMGYMFRYNPAMQYILRKVREGALGTITSIDATFCCLHDAEKRSWMGAFPGGNMFFLGCHSIDMILLINGLPRSVHAFNRPSGFGSGNALDSAFAVLDYPTGVATVRANATESSGYQRRTLRVVGTEGVIEIRPLESPTVVREATRKHAMETGWRDSTDGVFPGFIPGRYDEMMLDFARCVRGENQNPYTYEYELELQRVVLEACK